MTSEKEKTGIRAVAKLSGVSTATVSRALNNPQSVSEDLRARIQRVIDETGYVPHGMARALSSNRTRTIGAIIPTIDNAMFARGIESLQKFLSSRGYMLILSTNGYDIDVELEQARNLISRGVDGLILRGDCHHQALRDLLAARDVPFINVGIYNPSQPHPSIGVDNEAAAHRAMMHLIEIGHRRIGVVSALQRNNDRASARIRGFRRALAEHGLDLPEAWHVEVRYTLDDAREAARQILMGSSVPTAIACGNDVLAYGVMLEAERRGLKIPADLSVVGFDDLEWSRHLRPALTTLHVPTDLTWKGAGEYILARLDGHKVPTHYEVDYALVVRESTAPPASTA
ncbi:LacI family DNA-binding transcriptional regulator [Shinella yambaruensis]|uniref:Transcriptional regulator n=1 Tax=Shinella yambaruensis TaxID=415996 RepID=A0ABQ5ZE58_9HYPH|nr:MULTISPECIES: LacI family DNA-binding transcriptional regulator [Shinella]CAI0335516.1 Transcriptional regulator [Rhizobiaceae bacterium]CAK7259822.1 LacI family transcriptional regulator [Shinella sp. WSC3-e]MCJ8024808.1 LacI family DNA-binding transcriptional regulator [Shinella yambaruensis]MCO5137622.1 LacI family DNA-binding transcriptional regulator [Shinella sp.]MCU7979261.1 LacI family DNA-binding transcriptional regulator [Shinella yambaruensis]